MDHRVYIVNNVIIRTRLQPASYTMSTTAYQSLLFMRLPTVRPH